MEMDRERAAEALAAVRRSRARLAQAADVSPLRHLSFALVMGGWVASPAVAAPGRWVLMALLLVAVPLMVRWDRRQTGTFVNGYRRGRTLPLTLGMVATLLALLIASMRMAAAGSTGGPLLLGLAAAALALAASHWWSRIYRRELSGAAR